MPASNDTGAAPTKGVADYWTSRKCGPHRVKPPTAPFTRVDCPRCHREVRVKWTMWRIDGRHREVVITGPHTIPRPVYASYASYGWADNYPATAP